MELDVAQAGCLDGSVVAGPERFAVEAPAEAVAEDVVARGREVASGADAGQGLGGGARERDSAGLAATFRTRDRTGAILARRVDPPVTRLRAS
jgi:uncharacterized protein (UPF0548 family)